MSESTPESTPDSGDTTVNTGGGDAVVNTAPDGGGVDNNAPAEGGESSGGESGGDSGGDSAE